MHVSGMIGFCGRRRWHIKRYINFFSEIRDRPRAEQAEILDRARYEAFVSLRLTGQVALSLIASLGLAFAIIVGGQLLLGPSSRIGFISVGLGVIAAALLYYWLYAALLRRGLRKYLYEHGDG